VKEAVLYFWQGLKTDHERWTWAGRLIGIHINVSYDLYESVYDEAALQWKKLPRDRGLLLFLLSRVSTYGRTQVSWEKWSDVYGERPGQKELAQFLHKEQLFVAIGELRHIWPALTDGWSRLDVILPKLDSYFDDPRQSAIEPSRIYSMEHLAGNLAKEGSIADLERLRSYFIERSSKHPSEERRFRDVVKSIDSSIEKALRQNR
jgi:hypothetical protein